MTSFDQLLNKSGIDVPRSGDLLLSESKTGWFDNVIKFLSRSKITHAAMLVNIDNSWFVVETRPRHQLKYEYQMMPVDWWLERNPKQSTYLGKIPRDFSLNQKNDEKNFEKKIKKALLDPKQSIRPYRLRWLAIVYVLQEWFGINRPRYGESKGFAKKPMICSTMVQETWENVGVIEKGNYKSPGQIADFLNSDGSVVPILTYNKHNTLKTKFKKHFSNSGLLTSVK